MDILQQIINSEYGLVIMAVVAVGIIVLFALLARTLGGGDEDLKEKLRIKARPILNNATKMVGDGYNSQAVVEAHKAMEIVMKGLLRDGSIRSFDAIKRLESKHLLSKQNVDRAHNLRIQRNKAAHGNSSLSPQLARTLVGDAVNVVNQLLK